jgi:hypothetical protein
MAILPKLVMPEMADLPKLAMRKCVLRLSEYF